jgi:hypothetical protein
MILSLNGIIAGKGSTPILPTNLIMNLDAGNSASYSGSGTAWNDLSGNGNNATLINGTSFSSVNGGTMVYDGVDDVANANIINFGTQSLSFSFWVYPTQTTNIDGILGQGLYPANTTGGYVFILMRNDTATRRIQFKVASNGTDSKTLFCDNAYTLNAWNFITLTYNATTRDMNCYVNSVLKTSTTSVTGIFGNTSISQNLTPNNTSGKFLSIGMYDESRTLFPYTGNIAQAIIYNKEQNSTEITTNFNNTKTRFGL